MKKTNNIFFLLIICLSTMYAQENRKSSFYIGGSTNIFFPIGANVGKSISPIWIGNTTPYEDRKKLILGGFGFDIMYQRKINTYCYYKIETGINRIKYREPNINTIDALGQPNGICIPIARENRLPLLLTFAVKADKYVHFFTGIGTQFLLKNITTFYFSNISLPSLSTEYPNTQYKIFNPVIPLGMTLAANKCLIQIKYEQNLFNRYKKYYAQTASNSILSLNIMFKIY